MRTRSLKSTLATTAVMAAILVVAGCTKAQTPTPPATAAALANIAADTATNTIASNNPAVAGGESATAATSSGFVTAAATSDMYKISAAHLARQNATDPAVKAFAAKMIHDHTASTEDLKKAMATGAVTASLPADMDQSRKGLIDNLQKAAPADFDKTYMGQQVAALRATATNALDAPRAALTFSPQALSQEGLVFGLIPATPEVDPRPLSGAD